MCTPATAAAEWWVGSGDKFSRMGLAQISEMCSWFFMFKNKKHFWDDICMLINISWMLFFNSQINSPRIFVNGSLSFK